MFLTCKNNGFKKIIYFQDYKAQKDEVFLCHRIF